MSTLTDILPFEETIFLFVILTDGYLGKLGLGRMAVTYDALGYVIEKYKHIIFSVIFLTALKI